MRDYFQRMRNLNMITNNFTFILFLPHYFVSLHRDSHELLLFMLKLLIFKYQKHYGKTITNENDAPALRPRSR